MIRKLLFFSFLILSCHISTDYSKVKVLEVIDGDTVRLSNGKLLRYIGIDTPEVRLRREGKFVYSPQPFSLEAKRYNKELVENKFVQVEFDVNKKDKYGRLLGYCYVDGVFVNLELLKRGYATMYTYPPNVRYTELFMNAQKQARRYNEGLWGSYSVINHDQARGYIGEIRTVRGRVINSYKSSRCVFLNFSNNWKEDFTVVIFNNVLDQFLEKGIDPVNFYKNKTIEVSGRIREYNGPEIIVNTPYEIEVLNGGY